MKREILCKKCGSEVRARHPNGSKYPGEGIKFVDGFALFGGMICDHCAEPISEGEECTAFSIWADRAPYYEWEHEYIKVKEVENE